MNIALDRNAPARHTDRKRTKARSIERELVDIQVRTGIAIWRSDHRDYAAGVWVDGSVHVHERHSYERWDRMPIRFQRRFAVRERPFHWSTSFGSTIVDHLALVDEDGHLCVLWRNQNTDWALVDVTAKTGRSVHPDCRIQGLTYDERGDRLEHLVACDPDGQVVEFIWRPGSDWIGRQVFRGTPGFEPLIVAPTSLSVRGHVTGTRTHVAVFGIDARGALVMTERSRAGDGSWQSTVIATSGLAPAGTAYWRSGDDEHIAAADFDHSLRVYSRNLVAETRWFDVDATAECGAEVSDVSDAHVVPQREAGNGFVTECVVASGRENALGQSSVLRFWWTPEQRWQVQDLTSVTARTQAPIGSRLDRNGDVDVFVTAGNGFVKRVRTLRNTRLFVESLPVPLPAMSFSRELRFRDTRVLCWVFRDQETPPNTRKIRDAVFGREAGRPTTERNAADYFMQVSSGLFRLRNRGTDGWFVSDFPRGWYHDGPNPDVPEEVAEAAKWNNRHHRKYMEVLRDADDKLHLEGFDTNRNRRLDAEELGLVIAVAEAGSGFVRPARRSENPSEPMVLDGVRIGDIVEWYAGDPADTATCVHELCHLYLDLPDMYATRTPYAIDGYDVMSQRHIANEVWAHVHPCGVWKLMLGWVRPIVPLSSDTYVLRSVADSRQVIVLPHPTKGEREYFLLENRQAGKYDDITTSGIAIWHYVADREDASLVPFGVDADNWNRFGGGPRNQLRMIRPALDGGDTLALWDGAIEAASYPLSGQRPDDNKAALVWADGSDSDYRLSNISASGARMSLRIEVPR